MFEIVWKRDIFDSDSFKGKKIYIFLLLAHVHIVYLAFKRKLFRCACFRGVVDAANSFNRSIGVAMGLVCFSGLAWRGAFAGCLHASISSTGTGSIDLSFPKIQRASQYPYRNPQVLWAGCTNMGFHKHNSLKSVEQDAVANWIVRDVNVIA